jgi:hypothetical protein
MKRYVLPTVLLALTVNLAVAVAAKPPKGGNLSITAKPSPVVFGRTVALSGKLTGAGHAGKTVQVQADPYPYNEQYTNVATPTTAANGNWAASDKPDRNTRYRARQGGTVSGTFTERVRIRVSLRVSDRTPAVGQRVRFRGRACPQHDGARVRIQRRTRTGKWRTVRRTTLKDIAGSTCSKYSRRFRVFRDGTYRALVVSNDPAYANGLSRRRHLDAHH